MQLKIAKEKLSYCSMKAVFLDMIFNVFRLSKKLSRLLPVSAFTSGGISNPQMQAALNEALQMRGEDTLQRRA